MIKASLTEEIGKMRSLMKRIESNMTPMQAVLHEEMMINDTAVEYEPEEDDEEYETGNYRVSWSIVRKSPGFGMKCTDKEETFNSLEDAQECYDSTRKLYRPSDIQELKIEKEVETPDGVRWQEIEPYF